MDDAICVENLTKQFGDKKVLTNVSMRVKNGEIYAFIGANGAGKTTLMKLLFGILIPDEGSISLLGQKISNNGDNTIFKQIGNIIETPVFYKTLSAVDNLEIHCRYMGIKFANSIPDILELVGLKDVDDKKVGEFSLGMKQRLALARTLISNPRLLVLDEPINGMDPMGIQDTRKILININQALGTAMLISSHIISELAKLAHTVGIIDNGIMLEERSVSEIDKDLQDDHLELEDYFMNVVKRGNQNA